MTPKNPTTTPTEFILSQNEYELQKSLDKLEAARKLFTPLLTALRAEGIEPSVHDFRTIVSQPDALRIFLKKREAEKNPVLAALPDSAQKWAMIPEPNFPALTEALAAIRAKAGRFPVLMIYSFTFTKGKELELTPESLQLLHDTTTIKGTERQYKALKEAERIQSEIAKFKEEFGVHLIYATLGGGVLQYQPPLSPDINMSYITAIK